MQNRWTPGALAAAGVTADACLRELGGLLGEATGRIRSLVDLRLSALEAALVVGQPAILADQLSWERTRLPSIASGLTWPELDAECRRVLAGRLDVETGARVEEIDVAARALLGPDGRAPWERAPSDDPRVVAFLDLVLAGDRHGALALVAEAAAGTEDVSTVMLDLLQPAQWELGRAWQEGRATVAQEHLGTAVVQQALAMLYPRLFCPEPHRHRVVAVAGGDELHEVGLRIVTDILEQHGWDTWYLGAMLPGEDVLEQIAGVEADILALSVSMPNHLAPTRELVRRLRADPRCADVRVLVGGRLVNLAPDVVGWLGADACARDAAEVPAVCRRLLAERADERADERAAAGGGDG